MVSVITRINKVAHKVKVKEASFANVVVVRVVVSLATLFYSQNENLQRMIQE